MNKADLLKRIGDVRAQSVAALASKQMTSWLKDPRDPYSRQVASWVDAGFGSKFRASGVALLEELYGTQHQYYVDFLSQTSNRYNIAGFEQAAAIIEVVEHHVNNGWYESITGLVAGDVFSDFLDMADHLLDERYKDAAAVIAGSSLENHLKRLASKAGVPTTVMDGSSAKVQAKKVETINADLVKANVYDKNDQKQVTAWMGVRNDAAHGDYPKVDAGVVRVMIAWIRTFVSRYPA